MSEWSDCPLLKVCLQTQTQCLTLFKMAKTVRDALEKSIATIVNARGTAERTGHAWVFFA